MCGKIIRNYYKNQEIEILETIKTEKQTIISKTLQITIIIN